MMERESEPLYFLKVVHRSVYGVIIQKEFHLKII